MLSRIINPAIRTLRLNNKSVLAPTVRLASYAGDTRPVTMDDLPVPAGDWETQNKAKQAKNNMILGAGLAFFIFTIITAKASGLIVLNYYPPERPADN
ncbi:hypothetical protein O3M35_003295 [Rhynocoris fuscipes]|uniref:Deltamethrin resistance protein prag01 domain-containing protein n=1 Tax=Rhynocoris fuscipes TaxID=488301 RepID=A0AAW1CKX7_9HEMI